MTIAINVMTNETSIEFLLFSNPFAPSIHAETTIKAPILELANEFSTAERIYMLIKNGSFALGRQFIKDAFLTAAGQTESGQAANLKAIVKLCIQIAAQSYKSKSTNHLNIWFDPFSGRLELSTRNGLKDSLTVFTAQSRIAE